jgi:flagellar basal body-associated protein FliL
MHTPLQIKRTEESFTKKKMRTKFLNVAIMAAIVYMLMIFGNVMFYFVSDEVKNNNFSSSENSLKLLCIAHIHKSSNDTFSILWTE